jgi:sarcosine oxidase subunit gamma
MPESRLVASTSEDGAFHVRLASARAVLRLKSWRPLRADSAPFTLAGVALPSSVGVVSEGLPRALCTGPGEWFLVYAPTGVARLRDILAPELTTQGLALVDLTGGLTVFEVWGSHVRAVLAKSCGLDFDPRHFGAEHCARTRFAQIRVVIDCTEISGVFQLYIPRSYAPYLENWLLDAAVEFGDLFT